MSIDFATLQGLTIPEGVVTKVEDAAGNVLWSSFKPSGNVILEVEKIVSDTYAGSTTYTGEEFILLDIYPKSGGTVNVTYGGLTKTITDDGTSETPNAQQVFFGTFNGVSDDVTTPASGTLTIEGDYAAFGCGSYKMEKYLSYTCQCVAGVIDFGIVEFVPAHAFANGTLGTGDSYTKISTIRIPVSVTSISDNAFSGCSGLTNVMIPSGVTSIGAGAFSGCPIYSITIPASVTSIGSRAFSNYSAGLVVTMMSATPIAILGDNAFASISSYTNSRIIVPAGSSEAYKNAETWSAYADYITER